MAKPAFSRYAQFVWNNVSDSKNKIILVLIVFCLYLQTLGWQRLAWDDHIYVGQEPRGRPTLAWKSLKEIFDPQSSAHHYGYRPLQLLSYKLDEIIFAGSDFGYRLGNLLYHLLCVLLVYRLVKQVLADRCNLVAGQECSEKVQLQAGFTAFLFAVFPYHLEAVCWISERKGLLACLFMLLATGFDLSYRRNGKWRWLAGSVLCFAASLLSKSMWVTWPLLILILSFATGFKGREKSRLLTVLPLYLLFSGIMVYVQLSFGNASHVMPLGNNMWERLLFVNLTYAHYLYCFVDAFALNPINLWAWDGLPGMGILVAVVIATLVLVFLAVAYAKKGKPWLIMFLGLFLVSLLPVSNLVPMLFPHGDRFLYGPSLALLVPLAGLLTILWQRRRVGRVIVLAVLAYYGLATIITAQYWQNDLRLWDYALVQDQDNQQAHYNLAGVYAVTNNHKQAVRHFQKACQVKPGRLTNSRVIAAAEKQLNNYVRHR